MVLCYLLYSVKTFQYSPIKMQKRITEMKALMNVNFIKNFLKKKKSTNLLNNNIIRKKVNVSPAASSTSTAVASTTSKKAPTTLHLLNDTYLLNSYNTTKSLAVIDMTFRLLFGV